MSQTHVPDRGSTPSTPRWVKVFGIIVHRPDPAVCHSAPHRAYRHLVAILGLGGLTLPIEHGV